MARPLAFRLLPLGWLAGLLFGAALLLGAMGMPGYDHALHSVALLGSALSSVGTGFNLFGLVLPGLCLTVFAVALERILIAGGPISGRPISGRPISGRLISGGPIPNGPLPSGPLPNRAGRLLRIATGLLMISALAFAAQGLLPFDPQRPDETASSRHAVAYVVALLAWLAGMLLLSGALRPRGHWRPLPQLLPALAAAVFVMLLLPPSQWPGGAPPPGVMQRLILALYFASFALLAVAARRRWRHAGTPQAGSEGA